MKFTNLKDFEKQLASLAPHYAILGKDPVLVKRGLDLLKKRITPSELTVTLLDADRIPVNQVAQELGAFSLFSARQLLILSKIDKAKEPVKNAILSALSSPNEQVTLVLMGEALAANTKLYKAVEKSGVILSLSSSKKAWEKEKEVEEWLLDRAQSEGKQLDLSAARFLIQHVGLEISALEQEFAKLVCYVGDRTNIVSADVGAVCRSVNQKNVWQLGDAIFRLNVGSAMSIAKALLKDQVPLILLLRQIRKQFETDYQVCSLIANHASTDEITQMFPYMKGRILQTHIENARHYGLERLKLGLIEIDRTELEAKNSGVDGECLLELLIAKICR